METYCEDSKILNYISLETKVIENLKKLSVDENNEIENLIQIVNAKILKYNNLDNKTKNEKIIKEYKEILSNNKYQNYQHLILYNLILKLKDYENDEEIIKYINFNTIYENYLDHLQLINELIKNEKYLQLFVKNKLLDNVFLLYKSEFYFYNKEKLGILFQILDTIRNNPEICNFTNEYITSKIFDIKVKYSQKYHEFFEYFLDYIFNYYNSDISYFGNPKLILELFNRLIKIFESFDYSFLVILVNKSLKVLIDKIIQYYETESIDKEIIKIYYTAFEILKSFSKGKLININDIFEKISQNINEKNEYINLIKNKLGIIN